MKRVMQSEEMHFWLQGDYNRNLAKYVEQVQEEYEKNMQAVSQ